jgi:hypothetical protein
MEITLDIGKNTASEINTIAKNDGVEFDIAALKLLDLGIRVHLASLEKNGEQDADPLLVELLNHAIKSSYLQKEILGHVFDKESSLFKAYDALSACQVSENMAHAFLHGKELF